MPIPKGWKRKKLVKDWRRYCTPGTIRTVKSGKARVLICRPKGKRKTRAISIDTLKGFRGWRQEMREHPWATKAIAKRIARDHARIGKK